MTKRGLVHELQVHQAELEMQNEELCRVHADLAAARDRFFDLFEHAPVGYLALDHRCRIVEANLTAAADFSVDRRQLLGSPFVRFVAPADSDRWQRLVDAALRGTERHRIELAIVRQGGRPFHAQLDCRRMLVPGTPAQLRLTVTDLSQRRLAERNRRIALAGSAAHTTERRTLARALHEDLGQRLSALKLDAGRLLLAEDDPVKRAGLHSMAADIDEAVALVRQLSTQLHPLMIEILGLAAALDWLASDITAHRGLPIQLHIEEHDASMDAVLAIALYRLTESALGHFATHDDVIVTVELVRRPRDWVLEFQVAPDTADGEYLDAGAIDMPQSFADQVHLLGGRMELRELPGRIRQVSVFIEPRQDMRPGTSAARRTA